MLMKRRLTKNYDADDDYDDDNEYNEDNINDDDYDGDDFDLSFKTIIIF